RDGGVVLLPGFARPARGREWYTAQQADILHRTGSCDDLFEQSPATDTEALAPRALGKRLAPAWLEQCFVEAEPVKLTAPDRAPAIPGLVIYHQPRPGRRYVIGADPAEGNPTSDDSALEVLDQQTGEEGPCLAGEVQ